MLGQELARVRALMNNFINYQPKGLPFLLLGREPPLTGRSGRLGSGWCSGVDLYFCSQVRRPFRPPHCGTAAGGAALPQTNNININPWTPAGPQPPVGLLVAPPH